MMGLGWLKTEHLTWSADHKQQQSGTWDYKGEAYSNVAEIL